MFLVVLEPARYLIPSCAFVDKPACRRLVLFSVLCRLLVTVQLTHLDVAISLGLR
jgi:hypothetical protein